MKFLDWFTTWREHICRCILIDPIITTAGH